LRIFENVELAPTRVLQHAIGGWAFRLCKSPPLPTRGANAHFNRLTRDAATRNNCGSIPRPTETGAHNCANEASTDTYQGQQITGDHRDNTIARPATKAST
jgi:hypothetical protein